MFLVSLTRMIILQNETTKYLKVLESFIEEALPFHIFVVM